jgi:hypothetical protein
MTCPPTALAQRRRRLLSNGNNASTALHVSDVSYASRLEGAKADLSSRLWETEGTDPNVAILRKKLMDVNAPASLWTAIGEDDVSKLDELKGYGSEMTQGYLATATDTEKHALKALVGTTLAKAEQAVSGAQKGVLEAKAMGGESEIKRSQEDLKALEDERDGLLEAKAGVDAADHEGEKVEITTASVDANCNVKILLKNDMALSRLMSVKIEGVSYMQVNGDVKITNVIGPREAEYKCSEPQSTTPGKYTGGYVTIPTSDQAQKVYDALMEDPIHQTNSSKKMDAKKYLCHIGLFDCDKKNDGEPLSKPQLPTISEPDESKENSIGKGAHENIVEPRKSPGELNKKLPVESSKKLPGATGKKMPGATGKKNTRCNGQEIASGIKQEITRCNGQEIVRYTEITKKKNSQFIVHVFKQIEFEQGLYYKITKFSGTGLGQKVCRRRY